jgi:hypothetical protein
LVLAVAAGAIALLLNRTGAVGRLADPGAPDERSREAIGRATRKICIGVGAFVAGGLVAILLVAVGIAPAAGTLSKTGMFGFAVLVGATGGVIGGVLGFLFGIPRTVEAAQAVETARAVESALTREMADAAGTPPLTRNAAQLAANTNLERISDWLTTLLIGATLVQLTELPGWFRRIGEYAQTKPQEAIYPFALAYFFGLGFLGVYLITRLYLTSALFETLDFLTGKPEKATAEKPETAVGEKVEPATAEKPPSTLEEAKDMLTRSLAGSDEEVASKLKLYAEGATLDADSRQDPALNALYARLLVRCWKHESLPDDARLKGALRAAAKDEAVRAELLQIKDTDLRTGDVDLDREIDGILSSAPSADQAIR